MWNKADICAVCSQMRLQLLHFHAVFKTCPTFQELTSIVSFRRRLWSQRNFSGNRNRATKVKMCLVKYEDYEEVFFLPPDVGVAVLICLTEVPITICLLTWMKCLHHYPTLPPLPPPLPSLPLPSHTGARDKRPTEQMHHSCATLLAELRGDWVSPQSAYSDVIRAVQPRAFPMMQQVVNADICNLKSTEN